MNSNLCNRNNVVHKTLMCSDNDIIILRKIFKQNMFPHPKFFGILKDY